MQTFTFDDIQQRLKQLDHSFRSQTIDEIVEAAFQELVKRGTAGLVLVPIIYVICAMTSDYYDDHNVLFWILTLLFVFTTIMRLVSMAKIENDKKAVYFTSSVLIGLYYGVYAASAFYFYSNSWTNAITLFSLAAISGACISSYCIWKRLNQWYIVFLITPSIAVTLFTGPPPMRVVSFFCMIAFCYNFYQARLWNKNFWFGHVNVYLLQDKINHLEILEKDLLEERDRARLANQAKTEFLANMSHELRTPMHGILSYADFGIQRINKVPQIKIHEYFYEIADSGNRLMVLLNDLLDLAKLESGKMTYTMETQDISYCIDLVSKEFQPILEKNELTFKRDFPEKSLFTVLDHDRIAQVFRNLLSNSIKFSEAGKTIVVSIEECTEFINNTEQQTIKVSVSDQGVGIPEDELEHVFDKFIQSSKTRTGAGGTGLGLAICKQIIDEHKGKIEVENIPTGGSVFSFYLPVFDGEIVSNT